MDEDGYEVDSEDDDERAQTAMAAAADINPYSSVKIERMRSLSRLSNIQVANEL